MSIYTHETEYLATNDLLHLINTATTSDELIKQTSGVLKKYLGCDAIGIRLHEGDDFPYFETTGFSDKFVKTERTLCSYNKNGELERDRTGKPVLECLCGNILCGRYDSSKPFYTPHGSFWTNNTTLLGETNTIPDLSPTFRNRCNREGYESVGLFPMRYTEETVGLLQVNNKEKGLFTPIIISFLEHFADNLAIAFSQHRTREALEKSEILLKETQRISKLGGWEFDVQSGLTTYTEGIFDIYGKPVSGNDEGSKFYHPEDRPRVWASFTKAIADNIPYDLEVRMINANGKNLWVRTIGSPVIENGKVIKIIGNLMDITEQKLTELALHESKEQYQQLVELSPTGIAIYQEGKFVYINPSGLAMMGGKDVKEIIGKPVISIVHPESLSKVVERMGLVAKGISVKPLEEKLIRLDGSTFIGEVIALLTSYNDKPAGQVLVRDITERKRSEDALKANEEKYRLLLELAPDAFFHGDSNGNFITVNDKTIELTGFSKEELAKMNMSDLFVASEMEEKPLRYDLLNNGDTLVSERKILRKTGERIQVEMNSKSMPDGTYQCFMRDITERKKSEEALKENEIRLKELNATKDKFFSIIAHDLKSPFNSILGFSNLLTENVRENNYNELEKYTGLIQKSSQRAMDLLFNLLEWSRSQTGKMEFNPVKFEIEQLIDREIDLLKDAAMQKSITIFTENQPYPTVIADKAMVAVILRNLISNAIKFTHPGGKIIISAKQKKAGLLVTVSDNGVGIKKDAIEKLFRIDENYSTLGTQNEVGTGLGLLLCKEFVEKHGGKLWVESEERIGSTFYFTILKKRKSGVKENQDIKK